MKRAPSAHRRPGTLVILFSGALLAGLAVPAWQAAPAADDKRTDLSKFMRKKLAASSQILEGLTTEDAQLIQDGSEAMLEMSKAEIWQVLVDDDYRDFNREFRASMRKLDQAARDENFDRALLQWMDAVKGCVECHKYVRDHRPKPKK